ncbi:MAG: sigma-70 family RNA polymerase sigma factor [Minicystis sp.]
MKSPLSAQQRDWILAARPRAVRAALRLGAGNDVGLTRDDLRALAEDGLLRAAQTFDPDRGASFSTFAYKRVRGLVLRTLEVRRRQLAVVSLVGDSDDLIRAEGRAVLDDFGEGIDPDAYDAFEDTAEDFARSAQDVADDGLLVLILGRLARPAGAAEKLLIERDLLDRLEDARATLSPNLARMVQMRFDEERPLKEVAAGMGIPLTTAHRELAKVVGLLRRKIEAAEQ